MSAISALYHMARKLKPRPWTYLDAPGIHLSIAGCGVLKKLGLQRLNRRMADLEELKDRHRGDRCFIVCTGPSLKIEDLEQLKGEYTFGVNTIFLAYEQTEWRPAYYAMIDSYLYRNWIAKHYETDFSMFCRKELFLNSRIPMPRNKRFKSIHIHYGNHTRKRMRDRSLRVEEDISTCIYDCFTVTNMAINIAVYMGFKEINIIGADCNFRGKQMHFRESKFEDDVRRQQDGMWDEYVDRSIDGYMALKKFAEAKDVKIYNATRGGMLEVFERRDFDAIVKKTDMQK